MSKPWVIGDWAAEAERAEEEEKACAAAAAAAGAATSAPPDEASSTRPESVSGKPRKKKQTFSISEFTTGRSVSHGTRTRGPTDSRGFTPTQGMTMLPTGPRDRSGEQYQYIGLGGAFQDHRRGGDYRGASDRVGDERGYGGRPENDRMVSGFLHDSERIEPSRADGSSDWSLSKKTISPQTGGYGGERRPLPDGEKRGTRQGHPELPPSRADGADDWGLVKRSLPLAPVESRPARRNDDSRQVFRADETDNWTTFKKTVSPPVTEVIHIQSRADEAAIWLSSKTTSMGLDDQESRAAGVRARTMHQQAAGDSWRKPVVLTPQTQSSPPPRVMNADASTNPLPPLGPKSKSNPFGSARPREEVLASKDPDDQNQIGIKERESRPSSSHSSRPSTPENSGEPAVKPRPKVNPFGNAKPREVLLQERGKDWRKMDFDLEHRAVQRSETEEEIALREEIRVLTELRKQEMETSSQRTNGFVPDPSVRQDTRLHEELRIKEMKLRDLTIALDDKVRFSQKIAVRAGSQAGRSDIGRSSEMFERSGSRPSSRPGSRSGRSDTGSTFDSTERLEPRTFETSDRPYLSSKYGTWARTEQVANFRESTTAPERMGSRSGHKDNRGFDHSKSLDWRSAVPELGAADNYSRWAGGPDVWTRSNDSSHERSTGWSGQERGPYRGGARRF